MDWNGVGKLLSIPQKRKISPDVPPDIRPTTSVRPSKSWTKKIKHLARTCRADIHEETSVWRASGKFFREKQSGVENSGEGKTYRTTPPQKRLWTPRTYDTFPLPSLFKQSGQTNPTFWALQNWLWRAHSILVRQPLGFLFAKYSAEKTKYPYVSQPPHQGDELNRR